MTDDAVPDVVEDTDDAGVVAAAELLVMCVVDETTAGDDADDEDDEAAEDVDVADETDETDDDDATAGVMDANVSWW